MGEWPGNVKDKGMGCVMGGICLRYKEPDEENCKALNCLSQTEEEKNPQILKDEVAITRLKEFCAETLDSYGEEPGGGYKLCCRAEQIAELSGQIEMAQNIIERCPSCWKNFRQVFCELACSPYQIHFMEAAKIEDVPSEVPPTKCGDQPPDVQGKKMVRQLRLFFTEQYAHRTYNSCKDIVMGSANMPAMDFLCGNS